jgi:hypothetical protein
MVHISDITSPKIMLHDLLELLEEQHAEVLLCRVEAGRPEVLVVQQPALGMLTGVGQGRLGELLVEGGQLLE